MSADWNLPSLSSQYLDLINQVDARLDDLVLGMASDHVTATNVPTNAIRWHSTNNNWERYDGTTWGTLSTAYGITTTAAQALATARNIAISGDASGSASFNGSADVTASVTLATVNSNVGTFGSTSAVPVITVNGKGLITGITTAALASMASQSSTDVSITGGSGIFTTSLGIPLGAGVTTAGYTRWDSNLLKIGTGSAVKTFVDTDTSQILQNKTWQSATIGIAYGGTGATSQTEALNNLLPAANRVSGYVLTTGGSGSYYWTNQGAASQAPQGTLIQTTRKTTVATSNQTYFNGLGAYTAGQNQTRVFINGVRQYPSEYSENAKQATVSTVARTSNTVTIVTTAAHGLVTGDEVYVSVTTNTNVNVSGAACTFINTTTFTYLSTAANITTVADTGSVAAYAVTLNTGATTDDIVFIEIDGYNSFVQKGSLVTFTPVGNIAATDVQAAISELDTEKVAKAGDTMTGKLTLFAGTAATAALQLSSGATLTAATAGAVEWTGTQLFLTHTGNTRKQVAFREEIPTNVFGSTAGTVSINALTEDTTPDISADYLVTYDASAGAHKKVLANKVGGGGGAPSGITDTTSATNISLTSTSTFYQNVTMTTAGKKVFLPNATTFSTLGQKFLIRNTGALPFSVDLQDDTGYISVILPGEYLEISLTNSSSANGKWANFAGQPYKYKFSKSLSFASNQIYNVPPGVGGLSASTFLVTWSRDSNQDLYGIACSVSGTTITAGSESLMDTGGGNYRNTAVFGLSSTTGLILADNVDGYVFMAKPFSVSGLTITATGGDNNVDTYSSSTSGGNRSLYDAVPMVHVLSSTLVAAAVCDFAGGAANTQVIQFNGSAAQPTSASNSDGAVWSAVVPLSSSRLVHFKGGTNINARVIDVAAGPTLTTAADYQIVAGTNATTIAPVTYYRNSTTQYTIQCDAGSIPLCSISAATSGSTVVTAQSISSIKSLNSVNLPNYAKAEYSTDSIVTSAGRTYTYNSSVGNYSLTEIAAPIDVYCDTNYIQTLDSSSLEVFSRLPGTSSYATTGTFNEIPSFMRKGFVLVKTII